MRMSPQHDWDLYEEKCRDEHVRWLRCLTPKQALALHESFQRLYDRRGHDDTIDRQRFERKRLSHQKMTQAFRKLDAVLRG